VGLASGSEAALQRKARRAQAVLASCVPVLLFGIGLRFLPWAAAFAAGLAASLDYLLNAYAGALLTETLFTFVFYAYLLHLFGLLRRKELPAWRGAVWTGLLTAVLFLARGSLLLLLPAVVLFRGAGHVGRGRSARFAGVAILSAAGLVAAFTVAHGRFLEDPAMERPSLAAAVLYWGNNPETRPDEWVAAEVPARPLAAAARFIREQPGAWLRLKAAQALAFFHPGYSRSPFWIESYDAGHLGRFSSFRLPLIQDEALAMLAVPGFLLMWALGIADLVRGRRPVPLLALGTVVLVYAATYVVTVPHFRYRFPLNPLFYLLLAAVASRLGGSGLALLERRLPTLAERRASWGGSPAGKAALAIGLLLAGAWAVPALSRRAANAGCGGEEILLTRNADVTGTVPREEVCISSPSGDPHLHPDAQNTYEDPLRELVDGLRTGSGDVTWENIYWEGDWSLFRRQLIFEFEEETCLSRVRLAYARPYPNYRIDHVRVFVSRDGSEWSEYAFYSESERAIAEQSGLIEIDTADRRWRLYACDRRARFVQLELRINRAANFLRLGEVYLWGRRLTRPS
jgi:hypothetical protein